MTDKTSLLNQLLIHNLNQQYLTEEKLRLILEKPKLGVLDQKEVESLKDELVFWRHRVVALEKGGD